MSPGWADDDEQLISLLTGRYQREVPELFAPVPFEVPPPVRQWGAARQRRARRARFVLLLVVLAAVVVVLSWPD